VIKAVLHAEGRIPTPAVRLPLLPAGPGPAATARRHLGTLEAAAAGRLQVAAAGRG
jgi:4-hydroxy-tetrahydrodipicolinate synthase